MKKFRISAVLLSAFLFTGCTTTVNLTGINSRSPVIGASGTNAVEAATGFEGGGKLDAQLPVSP
jgi:PBP1b-binding outer membrane lipoprotein LpoB